MSDDAGLSGSIDGPSTLPGAIALLLVGLAISGYGVYDYVDQNEELRDSVTVEATITQADVVQTSSGNSGRVNIDYEPELQYEYQYEGTTYTGSSIYPADTATLSFDSRDAARSEISEYEENSTVTAYVLPSSPSESFLRAQRSSRPLVTAGFGVLIALFGAHSVSRLR